MRSDTATGAGSIISPERALILGMEMVCEDLPAYGVILVPPDSPEYDVLLADIERRVASPVAGGPPLPERARPRIDPEDRATSAILVNRARAGIASIYQIWTFQERGRKPHTWRMGGGGNPSVLLPFGVSDAHLKLYGYWHVILPGSKRYLSTNGDMAGDNSDVRPPAPDEIWTGGVIGGFGGRTRRPASIEKVTATLDGVFFTDGGFAGPNAGGLWDEVTAHADAFLSAARIARQGHDRGIAPAQILADIEALTGPAPENFSGPTRFPRDWTAEARARVARNIAGLRQSAGDEQTVYRVMAWLDAPVPRFRRL